MAATLTAPNSLIAKYKGAATKVSVDELVCDPAAYPEHYPRMHRDWPTVQRYAEAMARQVECGLWEFPPIVLVKTKDGYVVLDGWHRVAALRKRAITKTPAIVLKAPPSKWLWIAAELNIRGSRPLTMQDRASIGYRLRKSGHSEKAIATLLHMKLDTLVGLLATRISERAGKDGGRVIPLKSAVAHTQGTKHERAALENQGAIANANVFRTMDEMLALLAAHAIDVSRPNVRERAERIVKEFSGLLK